ncbi:MAG: hypothetical protein GY804_13825 [Alphaproteobacteria bacterium]|nr:hypothetical protein [Alphaproteobacteria bacterium]
MKVILKEGFTYIPKWNDNDKEKKADKIVVEFKFMTGIEVMDLYAETKQDIKDYYLKEWESICKSVTNLLDEDGKPIDIMEIPKNPGLAGLYAECTTAFRLESEVDKKK